MSVAPACLSTNPSCNHNPYFTQCQGAQTGGSGCYAQQLPYTKLFFPGIQGSLSIIVADIDVGQSLSFFPSQVPDGSTFVQIYPTYPGFPGPTLSYSFTWTPLLDSVSSVVCFKVQDNLGAYSLGNWCITMNIGVASLIYVSGIIRDFNRTNTFPGRLNNPDFGVACATANTAGCDNTVQKQFVSYNLGSDNTPSFNTSITGLTTVSSQTSFDAWFRDTANTNVKMIYSLSLSNGTEADPRIFTFYTLQFFAANALPQSDNLPNNYYFTYELHAYMSYSGGEVYKFGSADDLWVFVNRVLPSTWNLHGIHPYTVFTMNMDFWSNRSFGLTIGNIVTCDIFFAHRSPNHDPALQLQLPNAVLCDSLSSGQLLVDFTPNFKFSYPIASAPGTYDPQLRMSYYGDACWGTTSTCSNGIYPNFLVITQASQFSSFGVSYYQQQQTINGVLRWYPFQLKVLQGFSTTFRFQVQLGTLNAGTGSPQGFAFLIQSSSALAQGGSANQLGYGGIPQSLAIEFDSNIDLNLNDPGYNHVSAHTRYAAANDASESASIGISSANPPMTFTNGSVHTVRITYQPGQQSSSSATTTGWIRVYMNQVLSPVMQAQVNMNQLGNALGGAAWVGFSAGQGSLSTARATITINDWNMLVVGVSAGACQALSPPGNTNVNSPTFQMIAGKAMADTWLQTGGYNGGVINPGVMIVQTYDACTNRITVGNEPNAWTVTLTRRIGSSLTLSWVQGVSTGGVLVSANQDGTYAITFNPTEIGIFDIDVKFNNIPISGSPFMLSVNADIAASAMSYISFSPDTNKLLLQPHNAPLYNGQLSAGMWMVAVSPTTGLVTTSILYDFVSSVDRYNNGGTQAFSAFLNNAPTNTIIALACVQNCGSIPSEAQTAISANLGGTQSGQLIAFGSYAILAQKGVGKLGESVANNRASNVIQYLFSNVGPYGITVSVQSCGLNFGLQMTSTAGGFGRILVDPVSVFLQANAQYTFAVQLRDKWGNPAVSQASESLTLSTSPDITLSAGTVSNPTQTAPSYFNFTLATSGTKSAGQYSMYVKMQSVAGSYNPLFLPTWPTYAQSNIVNSPRTFYVVAAAASNVQSTASGSGLTASAVSQSQNCFFINLADDNLNFATNVNPFGADSVAITITGPSPANNVIITPPTTPGSSQRWVKCQGALCSPCPSLIDVCQFQVCYTGTIAGTYTVNALINGASAPQISGTQITVIAGNVDALRSQISLPASVTSGQISYFSVQSYDSAGNIISIRNARDFTVTIKNPLGADISADLGIQVLYNGAGSYTIQFTPVLAYTISISVFNPAQSGSAGLVGGTSYSLLVIPGPPSGRSTFVLNSGQTTVALVNTLTVTGIDAAGNSVQNTGGLFNGYYLPSIALTFGATLRPISINYGQSGILPSQTVFTFTATQSGNYSVNLQIASTGANLASNPNYIFVNPGKAACGMFVITGSGQFGGEPGVNATFLVQARDVYGNNVAETNGVFTLLVQTESTAPVPNALIPYGAASSISAFGYWNIGMGLYSFTYPVPRQPTPPNQFALSLVYPVNPNNPNLLTSCTIRNLTANNNEANSFCYSRPEDLSNTNGAVLPGAIGFSGGWNQSYVGIGATFWIVGYSDSLRSLWTGTNPSTDQYVINLYHRATGVSVSNIVISGGNVGQQAFQVSYTPSLLGDHVMNITNSTTGGPVVVCGLTDPIWKRNYAWLIKVGPGLINSFKTTVYNLNQADLRIVGQNYQFSVQPQDQYGNAITNSTYRMTATIDASNRFTGVYNPSDTRYYFDYTAQLIGIKTVTITEATLSPGALLGGQSFQITFSAALPDASKTDCSFV